MRSFTLKSIDHIVLRVIDLERSLAFYTSVLGCDIKKRRDDLGMVRLSAGTSMIDLVDVVGTIGRKGRPAADKQRQNVEHFCLLIEPFDEQAIVAHLKSVGLNVEGAAMRHGAEGEGLSIYCFDPDGNQIELKGPALQS